MKYLGWVRCLFHGNHAWSYPIVERDGSYWVESRCRRCGTLAHTCRFENLTLAEGMQARLEGDDIRAHMKIVESLQ
jgi:hypothetical protein